MKKATNMVALFLAVGLVLFTVSCAKGGDDDGREDDDISDDDIDDDDTDDDSDDDTDDDADDDVSECVEPYDDLEITKDTILCEGTYYLNDVDNDGVIQIAADGVTLNCNGAKLVGGGRHWYIQQRI